MVDLAALGITPERLQKLSPSELKWLDGATKRMVWLEAKEACEASLPEFIRQSWHIVEPGNTYIHGWHIDAICEHLEAITNKVEVDGKLFNRLLINCPPGAMKSLIVNVFWPSWEWGPKNLPHLRYVCVSHAQDLSVRDSMRMRRLVMSDWYKERWGKRVSISDDQNQKTKFENTATGFRQAAAAGSITGNRGDRVIIDDPHSVEGGTSDTIRATTIQWFLEAVPLRVNNPKESAIVVIMQRLHEEDVSGVILSKGLGYEHLCLPMRFEEGRRCETGIGFVDPRGDGDLLFPERFPEEVVARDEEVLGPYACNTGDAPVLMADLSLKKIETVKVGEMLLGFDRKQRSDGKSGRMRLIESEVLEVHSREAEVVRMTLDSGEVIRCTRDHRWFRKEKGDGRDWYGPVVLGRSSLARVCPTRLPELSPQDERLAGWLAGFFDGEGSVTLARKKDVAYRSSAHIAFYQTAEQNLPLCQKLEAALRHFGFDFYRYQRKKGQDHWQQNRNYVLRGDTLPLMQRFLHIVQPSKWRDRIMEGVRGSKFILGREKVVSIEPCGIERVYSLTTTTGNYVAWGFASSNCAGQFQQRPEPRGGGILKTEWWQEWDEEAARIFGVPNAESYPQMELILASVDTAYTTKEENDPSAMTVWGLFRDPVTENPQLMLMHAWAKRLELHGPAISQKKHYESDAEYLIRCKAAWGLTEWVMHTCKKNKVDKLLIEAKASGISVYQEIRRLQSLSDWQTSLINPGAQDKVSRAYAVQPIFAAGQIWAPSPSLFWVDIIISQCASFPKAAHDDLVDSLTQAINWFRVSGLLKRPAEVLAEHQEQERYKKKAPVLYDV